MNFNPYCGTKKMGGLLFEWANNNHPKKINPFKLRPKKDRQTLYLSKSIVSAKPLAARWCSDQEKNFANTSNPTATLIAPPIRVAICANGISSIRLPEVRIATSPVPPCPLWQQETIATSIGCSPIFLPTK